MSEGELFVKRALTAIAHLAGSDNVDDRARAVALEQCLQLAQEAQRARALAIASVKRMARMRQAVARVRARLQNAEKRVNADGVNRGRSRIPLMRVQQLLEAAIIGGQPTSLLF